MVLGVPILQHFRVSNTHDYFQHLEPKLWNMIDCMDKTTSVRMFIFICYSLNLFQIQSAFGILNTAISKYMYPLCQRL